MPLLDNSTNGHYSPPKKAEGSRAASAPKVGQRGDLAFTDGDKVTGVSGITGVTGLLQGEAGVVGDVALFIGEYVYLPPRLVLVMAAWVVAAYLATEWDRFPHLSIYSAEKRCAKTLVLKVLSLVVPKAFFASNISPAAVYRLIAKEKDRKPTLLLDEAQTLVRRGSESSEMLREIFCAAIERNAVVYRCGGANNTDVDHLPVYSPKVVASIGKLDGVLADRCIEVELKRKTKDEVVARYRSRTADPVGTELSNKVAAWADKNRDDIVKAYGELEPFDIANDRMAELLMPLQAVLTVENPALLLELEGYAYDLQAAEADAVTKTPGVKLLTAIRELFKEHEKELWMTTNRPFIPTEFLLQFLMLRDEEGWKTFGTGGREINAEGLARLLRPYGIKSERRTRKNVDNFMGYYKARFTDAWSRYLPPLVK